MKFEIGKFSISFSKTLAKTDQITQTNLENRIQTLEQNFKNEEGFNSYNLCKLEFENIYDKKAEGAKIVANVNGINMEKNQQMCFSILKNMKL